MEYSFRCPFESDAVIIYAQANDDDDAVEKLTAAEKDHMAQSHPDIKISDEELQETVQTTMWHGAPQGAPSTEMHDQGLEGVKLPSDET